MQDSSKHLPSRFVKRMTPISLIGRATQEGILATAKSVLGPVFSLSPLSASTDNTLSIAHKGSKVTTESTIGDGITVVEGSKGVLGGESPVIGLLQQPFNYRILPSLRNHTSQDVNRDWLIQSIAGLVTELGHGQHKVNLKSPDKSIIVDVFQTVCGLSVLDGEYDALKRYNLAEVQGAAIAQQIVES